MRISDWSSDVCSSDLLVTRCWGFCPKIGVPSRTQHIDFFRFGREIQIMRIQRHFTVAGDDAYAGLEWKTTTSRSDEHTSELQSLMRISYAVFCLKKKTT